MEDLKKQVEELTKQNEELKDQLDLIMVQLEQGGKYTTEYENLEVFDKTIQLMSGLTMKRVPTNNTNLPVGRVWNDGGTLKIKQ